MGNKNKNKNKRPGGGNNEQPFVSICTPTYNRRPFIPSMIKCFAHQTYPKHRLEWIIIDDGTDKIEELVVDIPQVKYFKYDEKMVLGKKRNLMHEKACGDIIVYMDDDDYYPPTRISHAVNMLLTHPKALCAGSSEIYIYFKHIEQMVQFGPYGPNHATAGTFAFKKELLDDHRYNEEAALAEEKSFLKDYTVPFVQLEPKKTILVFSHIHNTFDKKTLLENKHPKFVKDSDKTVDDFVKESDLKDFYMNQIEVLLADYKPGRPEMKPDVLKQIEEIKIEREKQSKQMTGTNPQMMQQMLQQNPQMLQKMMEQNENNGNSDNNSQQNPQMQQQQMQQQMMQQQMQQQMMQQMQQNPQMMQQMQQNPQMMQQMMQQQQQQQQQQQGQGQIMADINGKQTVLSNDQIVSVLKQQQEALQKMQLELQNKDKIITKLQKEVEDLS